jgi:carboxymethylenebutenolidase
MANATTDRVGQELLLAVWQQHCYSEFVMKDAKAALTTMSDNPHVLMVRIATGGRGRDEVSKYYHDYFLAQLPADIGPVPISQVVGKDIILSPKKQSISLRMIKSWTG